jgi:hypothetical protein
LQAVLAGVAHKGSDRMGKGRLPETHTICPMCEARPKRNIPLAMNAITTRGRIQMSPKTWLRSLAGPKKDPRPQRVVDPTTRAPSLTIRYAASDDADALRRLADLDSTRPPHGPVLLAEVGGEPWAALSLDDYHAVADPFHPTAELVWLLVHRARDLERTERRRTGRSLRLWPTHREEASGLAR